MIILGISAYYHDSAACLIKDGEVIAGVEEERFSRIKHDNNFPYKAIEFCLKFAGLTISGVDDVSYYEKPLLKFERILETFLATWPKSLKPFLKGIPEWLDYKIKVEQTIRKLGFAGKIFFIPHHLSHASAAFYASPFEKAAILTLDGVGEWQTTGLWLGEKNKIKPLKAINFPHSLGLLYSTFTSFLGFKINEDEYKVMGLSAYGKPKYATTINPPSPELLGVRRASQLIEVLEDGSFRLNLNYFSFRESFQMWSREFEKLLGKPRKPDEPITQRHKDIAASIQKATEEIYFKILNHLYQLTKIDNVCLSGGVALNSLANGKIYEKTPFKNVWVFGPAGDSGAALGSALFVYYHLRSDRHKLVKPINNLYFGSAYDNNQIKNSLEKYHLKIEEIKRKDELITRVARLLADGKIIGWFQGRMEFGPRALGSRSILANPKPKWMKEKVNEIKRREQFRPFAGSILQEKVHEYFYVPEKNHWSPFMTFCFKVRKDKEKEISAIVHQDKTCRIQTVNKDNDIYYELIKKFYQLTSTPCLLNTSFNLKGEPIVEKPQQAIEDFLMTKMDYLVIGNFLIYKK